MTEFVEVKTADLVRAALDWVVANIEGVELGFALIGSYRPSTRWSQGGPLIEKYRIDFAQYADQVEAFSQIRSPGSKGPTYLIAACRAIVASVLGSTVSVPKELLS